MWAKKMQKLYCLTKNLKLLRYLRLDTHAVL